MPEPFDVSCSICGTPMLPNLSQADEDGCLWICINPDCPELCAGELETEDLVEGGVPQALAARLVRLIDYYEDTIEELHAQGAGHGEEGAEAGGGGAAAPPLAGSRERAQADLASLRRGPGRPAPPHRHGPGRPACPRRRGGALRSRPPRRRRRRGVPRRHRPRVAWAAHRERAMNPRSTAATCAPASAEG